MSKSKPKTKDWKKTLVSPVTTKNAEGCAHYYAMLHDLDLANMALVRMAQHQSLREHEDSDVISENIYLDYALMHYFRCFGKDKHSLNMKIFESLEGEKRTEAKRLHNFFKEAYELKSNRPSDIFSSVKIALALEEGKKKGVRDIFWLMNRFQLCKPELNKAFAGLVMAVKKEVEILAKTTTETLLKEGRKEDVNKLYEEALSAKAFSEQKPVEKTV